MLTSQENRKATFDYTIEDRLEAGIILAGWEVKAIHNGNGRIQEAHVIVKDNTFQVVGMHIAPEKTASTHVDCDPTRVRTLLVKKNEFDKWSEKVKINGYTIVMLDIHMSNGKIKSTLGLAKGKKLHDKREAQRNATIDRDLSRLVKTAR